jgi:two-component system sensor histidine kinase QseC
VKSSIRARLTITLIVSTGILMLSGFGALDILVERALRKQFDQTLLTKTRLLTRFPEVDRNGINLEFTEYPLPEFERPDQGEYYQLWLRDGTVLSKSRSLGTASLRPQFGTADQPVYQNIQLPDGHPGRAVGIGFFPSIEAKNPAAQSETQFAMGLVLARDKTSLNHLLTEVRLGISATGCLLLLLTGWVVNRSLRKGLAPINRLACEVETLEAASLTTARISQKNLPCELTRIATELNRMIERLNSAFQREQRLTSDIAHEINTPMSELRAISEVALKWPDDPEATRNLAQQTLDTTARLQDITGEILELARQQNAASTELQIVDLPELWADVRREYSAKALKWKMIFHEELPEKLLVKSNPVLLRSILSNLLENAIEYSPSEAAICCTLSARADGYWIFTLENPNTSLTETDLEHLFDPLWRHDSSRSSPKHSGLGLSLVKTISTRLGIHVRACLPAPETFRIVLEFPKKSNRCSA